MVGLGLLTRNLIRLLRITSPIIAIPKNPRSKLFFKKGQEIRIPKIMPNALPEKVIIFIALVLVGVMNLAIFS